MNNSQFATLYTDDCVTIYRLGSKYHYEFDWDIERHDLRDEKTWRDVSFKDVVREVEEHLEWVFNRLPEATPGSFTYADKRAREHRVRLIKSMAGVYRLKSYQAVSHMPTRGHANTVCGSSSQWLE